MTGFMASFFRSFPNATAELRQKKFVLVWLKNLLSFLSVLVIHPGLQQALLLPS